MASMTHERKDQGPKYDSGLRNRNASWILFIVGLLGARGEFRECKTGKETLHKLFRRASVGTFRSKGIKIVAETR
jgi:hypothetical protein